jgi:L-seryl-tRNA(Ser) seleniumtransferase
VDAPLVEQPRANAADIPSVDRLLNQPALAELLARHGRTQVTAELR